jgi:hypothetical protein
MGNFFNTVDGKIAIAKTWKENKGNVRHSDILRTFITRGPRAWRSADISSHFLVIIQCHFTNHLLAFQGILREDLALLFPF